ncbi:unnamed protein product [Darwinula stevensoni]|uniref:Store-operated calcium entry-associated regulatory factor n=1 Tax=Darwinula stevensoni TaxID=69355 RepID=A0A7R9A6D7_9CRUS|nr:unnamed protein product [Darwinula stevensoni]CAG0887481.1 unnamed protein product [Darwinula stevensoni]
MRTKFKIKAKVGCPFSAWGSSNRVRLGDVKTLTLTNGKMTTARRGSAVPQVKCVGGSAGCSAFTPHVIQCYNQGYDGRTYQWKCVADMDDRYTFGRTDVTCEGYDSPYDEHILAGSCGVEYTLELTEAGRRDKGSGDSWSSGHSYDKHSGSGWGGNFIIMIVVCILIYAIYRTCVAQEHLSTSYNADDYPSDNPTPGGGAPPPYGFHPDYTQRQPPPPRGFRPNYTQRQPPPPQDTCGQPRTESPGLGGFWTGAATGGLLGYMFAKEIHTMEGRSLVVVGEAAAQHTHMCTQLVRREGPLRRDTEDVKQQALVPPSCDDSHSPPTPTIH